MEIHKLYHCDCRDLMKQMPDNFVDLIVTDPPYGINKDFESDSLKEKELTDLWIKVFKESYRILKDNKSLLVEVPKNKNFYWQCFNDFVYEYSLVLRTTNAMRKCKVGYNDFSLCLWFSKNGAKVTKRYKDCISVNFENNIKEFRHPSPKNISHYRKLIEMFSNENDLIADFFMGSGTTAVACIKEKRNWIGSEISKEYCEIAQKRIDIEQSKLTLF